MTALYIDADACPVKAEAERVATRHKVKMFLVSNGGLRMSQNPLVEVVIEGARTYEDARKAARTVAGSTLLKAAVYGRDPNWGRAIAALGRSGVDIDPTKLALWVNEICVLDEGKPIPFFKEAAVATMRQPEVRFLTKLGLGNATATAWTCDLTEEYVRLNSDYTT